MSILDVTKQPGGGTTPGGTVTSPVASALANAPAPAPAPAPTDGTSKQPGDGVAGTGPGVDGAGGGDGVSGLPDVNTPQPVPGGPPGLPDVNTPIPVNPTGGGGLFGDQNQQEQGMWVPNAFQGDLLAALGGVIPPNLQPGGTPGGPNVQPGGTPGGVSPTDGTLPVDGTPPADGTINNAGLAGTLNNAVDTGPP